MPVQMRRPKAVVFDILGTASKSGFLEKILFPFLKSNLENYINTHWSKSDFIKLYAKIVEQSIEFNKQEPNTPIVSGHETAQGKASLLNFINFVTENGINSPAVTQLRFKVWFEGYQHSKIKTPIYSDVPDMMRIWFAQSLKFYVFSNTWVEAQKALLKNTNHGDLTSLISGHYDNDFGQLGEPDSWRRLCTDIHVPPNDVLFLTKSPVEGKAAAEAGISVVLVLTHRHNVKAVSKEDRQMFPYVRTLRDLSWLDDNTVPAGSEMPSTRTSGIAPNAGQPVPTAMSNQSGNQVPLVSTALPASGSSATGAPRSTQAPSTTPTSGASQATHTGNSTGGASSPAGSGRSTPKSANVGSQASRSHSRQNNPK